MAHTNPIARDATLASIRKKLDKPEDFVIGAMRNMRPLWRDNPDTRLRIGVTGKGKAPNYRLEPTESTEGVAFNGANHEPFPPDEQINGAANWSTATMSWLDLQATMGEIRSKG